VNRFSASALLVVAGMLTAALPSTAALLPPTDMVMADSAGVRLDKGVEFVRLTNSLAARRARPGKINVLAAGIWKTDWQTPEGGADRERQDGRWYFGLMRGLVRTADLWLAASGEHFDDRPIKPSPPWTSEFHVTPQNPNLEGSSAFLASQGISSVRILRSGAGIRAHPWQPLTLQAAAGPMEDRRIGRLRSGLGVWSAADVDHWNLSGYDQSLSLAYNRETARDQTNEDFSGNYELYREFFEGNSNRATLSLGAIRRDVYFDATRVVARRNDRNWAVRDVLTYDVTSGMRTEVAGEILHQMTEQGQADLSTSSLEENQAGFTGSLQAHRGEAEGELTMGMRSVTQTVRGDILQGRKTDLALQGQSPLPGRSILAVRLSVSKYTLDTRSTSNNDDRDELRYNFEAAWTKPVYSTLSLELHALTRLDHLVYVYRQSSANNRWARFFLAGSTLHHRPSSVFEQTVRWNVSADYQDYDFETDPASTRSTVHRRLTFDDSLTCHLASRFTVSALAGWQIEEFGRLFWESFEEEKSDETRSLTAAADLFYQPARAFRISGGALWDSRKGRRFGAAKGGEQVFLDLRSYGPTFRLEYAARGGFRLRAQGRALRQFQLESQNRWIIMGEIVGVLKW
jgi:hypothetical protein